VTPSTGIAAQIALILTVTPTKTAVITSIPTSIDLFGAIGTSTAPVTLNITNTGKGPIAWTSVSNSTWLIPSPTSAAAPGTLTLTPATASLPDGNQVADVTVASVNATNSQIVIPVTIHVGTTIFTDNFTSSSQWTASPLAYANDWTIAGNAYHYKGTAESVEYACSSNWTNYIYSTSFQLTNLKDYPGGVRGRLNLSTGASYAAWIYPAEKVIKLWLATNWNIDDSGQTLLGTSPTLTVDTKVHSLRMACSGSTISVYYDGILVTTATDTTLTSGAIALDGSTAQISFSAVNVLQQ
jgi:hypothetical protein